MNLILKNGIFSQPCRQIKSPNFNFRPDGIAIKLLVIHCISLPAKNYQNNYVEDFFCNKLDTNKHNFEQLKGLKVSSHLYIKRTGEIIQFVNLDYRAWHAGQSSWQSVSDCNNFSIGIELQGCEDSTFTKQQYQTLTATTLEIQRHYPLITNENIVGHSDIAPNRKTDPGKYFDWQFYLSSLALKCN